MLGAEWPHLATILGVPPPLQDQLRLDNPSNTKQQIYNMLRLWRDGNPGTKEQLKGALHTALLQVHRTDLAENLMMEQVDGSNEHVARQKMTSLLWFLTIGGVRLTYFCGVVQRIFKGGTTFSDQ